MTQFNSHDPHAHVGRVAELEDGVALDDRDAHLLDTLEAGRRRQARMQLAVEQAAAARHSSEELL